MIPPLLALGYAGYLVIALGPEIGALDLAALLRGEHRILHPAEVRGAPLRAAPGGADRLYLLTSQAERIVPLRPNLSRRLASAPRPRDLLHADLWAFDPATARPLWRQRLRTFEGDRPLLAFDLLGADGGTLWLFVREPLAVALDDGRLLVDGAALEARNPPLAGKRVDQPGFVAFGGQGLQLTLSDSTQWVVGEDLIARPRAAAPSRGDALTVPALRGAWTHVFQVRGLPFGDRWLGVLSDAEADVLRRPPVVPGAAPGERRGVMAEALERWHVPGDLTPEPRPYRLWGARVARVSAAPPGWPPELPDNWGTRERFFDYEPLPEAPPFLQAGLLGDGRAPRPFWLREPDSVVVLHHDKVGDAGRLRLARVAGPTGRVVWDAALPLADLLASTAGPGHYLLLGTLPNQTYDPRSRIAREAHEVLVSIDVRAGVVTSYDLTAESVRGAGAARR